MGFFSLDFCLRQKFELHPNILIWSVTQGGWGYQKLAANIHLLASQWGFLCLSWKVSGNLSLVGCMTFVLATDRLLLPTVRCYVHSVQKKIDTNGVKDVESITKYVICLDTNDGHKDLKKSYIWVGEICRNPVGYWTGKNHLAKIQILHFFSPSSSLSCTSWERWVTTAHLILVRVNWLKAEGGGVCVHAFVRKPLLFWAEPSHHGNNEAHTRLVHARVTYCHHSGG